MVRTGTNKRALAQLNGDFLAAFPIRKWRRMLKSRDYPLDGGHAYVGKELDGSIIAIGNAPTALFEVIRMMEEDGIRPALIIGIPVGLPARRNRKMN